MACDASFRSRFERDGFVVIDDFSPASARTALRERALEIVDAFDPAAASIFTTRRDAAARNEYFLSSGTAVRCFLEEEAFDEHGALRASKARSINKIGHALHDLDTIFARFSRDRRLHDLVTALGMAQPRVVQSMYIFKQPHIGGEVDWHQDATFFATEPQTVITLWFAIERADRGNGCLRAERGAHRGPLREQFVAAGGSAHMIRLDDAPWPATDRAEALEVDAGSLVVMHGLLPHYSAPNRSPTSRHAYTLHVVDGTAAYDRRNWLQRGAESRACGFT